MKKLIKNIVREHYCKKLGLPKSTKIYHIKNIRNIKCGENCIINSANSYIDGLELGDFSYIDTNASINGLKVGKFCCLAKNLHMAIGEHPTSKFVSIYPSFFSNTNVVTTPFVNKQKFKEFKYVNGDYHFEIGNDVWIGSNVLLIEGHKIGDGAIVAAGSVVTKDIPPYEIWGGNPARFIKKRFTDEQIEILLKLKWWDWPIDKIKQNAESFEDIELFIKNYNYLKEVK